MNTQCPRCLSSSFPLLALIGCTHCKDWEVVRRQFGGVLHTVSFSPYLEDDPKVASLQNYRARRTTP